MVHVPDNMLCVQQSQAPAPAVWRESRNPQPYQAQLASQQQQQQQQGPVPSAPALGIPCGSYVTGSEAGQQQHTNTPVMYPSTEQVAAHHAAASQYGAQMAMSGYGFYTGGAYPQMGACSSMPVPAGVSATQ